MNDKHEHLWFQYLWSLGAESNFSSRKLFIDTSRPGSSYCKGWCSRIWTGCHICKRQALLLNSWKVRWAVTGQVCDRPLPFTAPCRCNDASHERPEQTWVLDSGIILTRDNGLPPKCQGRRMWRVITGNMQNILYLAGCVQYVYLEYLDSRLISPYDHECTVTEGTTVYGLVLIHADLLLLYLPRWAKKLENVQQAGKDKPLSEDQSRVTHLQIISPADSL